MLDHAPDRSTTPAGRRILRARGGAQISARKFVVEIRLLKASSFSGVEAERMGPGPNLLAKRWTRLPSRRLVLRSELRSKVCCASCANLYEWRSCRVEEANAGVAARAGRRQRNHGQRQGQPHRKPRSHRVHVS